MIGCFKYSNFYYKNNKQQAKTIKVLLIRYRFKGSTNLYIKCKSSSEKKKIKNEIIFLVFYQLQCWMFVSLKFQKLSTFTSHFILNFFLLDIFSYSDNHTEGMDCNLTSQNWWLIDYGVFFFPTIIISRLQSYYCVA